MIYLKNNFIKRTLIILLFFTLGEIKSQSNFYDQNTIQNIEIFFSQPNWDYQMDTAKYGAEGYVLADSVRINGQRFFYPGVKYKGNSSYDSTYKKNPLHIELDYLLNQSFQSITDIKLSNGYGDPSMIREVLGFDILKNYMYCPKANFAKVFINGNYIGLYTNTENVGKDFCSSKFYSTSNNTFFKCNPIVTPTPLTKSNLKYISNDSSAYFNFYELKSTTGWNDLVKLCDTITNFPSSIPSNMDLDCILWMLAFNNAIINLDSYSGVFSQNYYLYKDNTGHFNPVVWDLNMSFGGFPFVGSGATSMGSLTIANMQQLTSNVHSTDAFWPLIKNVLSNLQYKRMYIAHLKTIINEAITSGNYANYSTQFQSLIDTAVLADTNKFFTYAQFQGSMNNNYTFGSYSVPGISLLMNARSNYLNSTAEFLASQPSVSNINADSANSSINDSITITAYVNNANNVFLGYRNDFSEKFKRIIMFDDGLHEDGAAGDNIYGCKFLMTAPQSHYYVYAENTNAGIFSPERAEHEFYTANGNIISADSGKVKINEILAVNVNGHQNEYLKNEDWIEFHNLTGNNINLYGLYLTDDPSNLTKFPFTVNSVVPANGFLTIWADESAAGPGTIHCNFKLSSNGEKLILSNQNGIILDSLNFGSQQTDISYGRCPDGTGSFLNFTVPSFNASNCTVGINDKFETKFKFFPNPASSSINLVSQDEDKIMIVEIINNLSQDELNMKTNGEKNITRNLNDLHDGIYILRINKTYNFKLIVTGNN
ncbi:MAG: CotH kinase family protein [Bacteroidota bacterium]